MIVAGALAQGNTSAPLNQAGGHRNGMPGGTNVGGWSFPPLQAGVAAVQIISAIGLKPKDLVKAISEATKKGQRVIIKEVDKEALKMVDELIANTSQYEVAQGLNGWYKSKAYGGVTFGTTYDQSHACPTCGTGVRQTSSLILDDTDLRTVDKHRIATSTYNDLLVRDTDVENLVTAKVTGALFWPASVKRKSGVVEELRWQQAVIESVLPPMAASSSLDRKGVCSTCHRGGFAHITNQSLRTIYRAEDLANAQDFNLTWELFGDLRKTAEGGIRGIRWSDPLILVTPKVMNLLRGKTKKEQKYQGCDFIPIWIEA